MRASPSLKYARTLLRKHGGWLISAGPVEAPHYIVTDDERVVVDMRGPDFVVYCEERACWDETRLPAAAAVSEVEADRIVEAHAELLEAAARDFIATHTRGAVNVAAHMTWIAFAQRPEELPDIPGLDREVPWHARRIRFGLRRAIRKLFDGGT
jgi:hypothetical protein